METGKLSEFVDQANIQQTNVLSRCEDEDITKAFLSPLSVPTLILKQVHTHTYLSYSLTHTCTFLKQEKYIEKIE